MAEGAAAQDALMLWAARLKPLPQNEPLHPEEKINKNEPD